ncbi:MAG: M24 family metallopeptidase [Acidimicrobiales bacterium]
MTDTLDELEAMGEKFSVDKLLDVRARTRHAVHMIADQVEVGADDMFFVDFGPIYEECEGDAGDTFVVGDDPDHHRAKRDARAIWEDTRQYWFDQGATGKELYDFASQAAENLGWKLNLDLSGHRLSDFPHSAHYDGSIADVPFALHPDRWVLEIAIVHPERPFGAFYEDLLLEDQSSPEWVFAAN